jgi:hypothetical protein
MSPHQWLYDLTLYMLPMFAEHGYRIPIMRLHVAYGLPPSIYTEEDREYLEYWGRNPEEEFDGLWGKCEPGRRRLHVYVTGEGYRKEGELGLAGTLAHELIHACHVPRRGGNWHGKRFRKAAVAIGIGDLTGEGTHTGPLTDRFKRRVQPMLDYLGPFPGASALIPGV